MPLIAAVLVGLGVLSLVYAVHARGTRRVHNLRQVLDVTYEKGADGMTPREVSGVVARAGVLADRMMKDSGVSGRLLAKIERSDWKVGPGEFMVVSVAGGVAGFMFGLLSGSVPLAVLLAGVALAAPTIYVNRSVERRRSRFEEQFPDLLDLIAASLESGASMSQAIELVVAEADDPARFEFSEALSSTRLGIPLVDALRNMAQRVGSRDLDWTVQAIIVQQRTGGRLADILHTVAEFMRGREEIRREIRALTAEGRLSAYVLGGLPFALAGIILVINPGYLDPLFTTLPGVVMTVVAGIMLVIGFIVMSRIIKIEV